MSEEDEELLARLDRRQRPEWARGQAVLQGFVGTGYFQDVTLEPDAGNPVEIDSDELDNFPVLGGGGQWKLAGERFDFGVEGMIAFSWRSDVRAAQVGGGGAVVAVDVDALLVDLFGGPFVSVFLGERARIYAAAGPLLQYLEYSEEDDASLIDEDESGTGAGVYARAGIEFLLPSRLLVGLGVRASTVEVDLGDDIGDFEGDEIQALITVSRGL